MIKVQGDDPIVGELTLNAESVAAGVRSGKAGIDGYREVAGLEHIEGERTERTPEPEIGRHTGSRVCRGQESAGTETGELLDVALVNGNVSRNRRWADLIQMVDSEVRSARRVEWVRARLTSDLCVGLRGREAQSKQSGSNRGHAVEQAREGERLTLADIRATEEIGRASCRERV